MRSRLQRHMGEADDGKQSMVYLQQMESIQQGTHRWGGSVHGHIVIDHDHAAEHARVVSDYFSDNLVDIEYRFHRRYVPVACYWFKFAYYIILV